MKKILFLLVAVMLVGVINVKAMTESELKTKLENGFEINGEVIKPTAYQLQELERYFNKYEISDKDATFISEKVDEIYELAKNDKAKTFTNLSSTNKAKIVSIVAEISSQTSVKATLTNNGVLTIFESDGKTVFTKIVDKDIARQTGVSNALWIGALVISIFGIGYIAKKASNNA